jgi:pSer/pThr/pTyr-binding forkhead associated (FHA) protein
VRTELIVVTGAERGQVFDLVDGQTLRVGRNPDMDVHLSGMGVSRRHCEISREADQVWLRDVGSTNGTAVANITRILAPQLLQPDDVIRLSDTVLVFRQYGPMTEAQWLAETNPERLLEEMRRRFGTRKLQLFGLGCCRLVPHLEESSACRDALNVLRQCADNLTLVEGRELQAALLRLRGLGRYIAHFFLPEMDVDWGNLSTGHEPLIEVGTERWEIYLPLEHCLSYNQCDLIRELSGNPYRPTVLDPFWGHWNDGCVGKMARLIYNEERFEDLPILADALEEAGCTEGPLLEHLREYRQAHVRGCWAVDLLLGQHHCPD